MTDSESFETNPAFSHDQFGFEYGLHLHERCLAGDQSAFTLLADLYLMPLAEATRRANMRWRDEDDCLHAAMDAIMSYKKRPETYNPIYGKSLFHYLFWSASGDFKNILKSHLRHNKRQVSLHVENPEDGSEYDLEIAVDDDTVLAALRGYSDVFALIESLLPDPRDCMCVWMMLENVRETAVYAEIYGITDLSPEEQARDVKRHKDRIKKRLQRSLERGGFQRHD